MLRVTMSLSSPIPIALCVVGVLALAQKPAPAQVWKFDESFKPRILREGMTVNAVARQPDGKIIVSGEFVEIGGAFRNRLARLHPDGSVDDSFDPGSGLAGGLAFSLGLAADGNILLGGAFFEVNSVRRPHLARLLPNGKPDPAFNPGTGPNGTVSQLAVQQDGKVVMIGAFSEVNGISRSSLARLNVDGSVDATFDPAVPVGQSERIEALFAEAVAVQPDGKFLVGGRFERESTGFFTGVVRFNGDGSLDKGFNAQVQGGSERILAISVYDDGRIVIAGSFTNVNSLPRRNLARLLSDGSTDASFNVGEIADRSVRAIAALADGSVVIGGSFTNVAGIPVAGLAKLAADGAVDPAFTLDASRPRVVNAIIPMDQGRLLVGSAPLLSAQQPASPLERLDATGARDNAFSHGSARSVGRVFSMAATPDDKIVLGGTFDWVNGSRCVGLARLRAEGSLDESFNPVAAALDQLPSVSLVAVQADSKVVFYTLAVATNGVRRHIIARLQADGSLDSSFQSGEGPDNRVRALAITGDQRIVAGGDFRSFDGQSANAIIRLLPAGSLDGTFVPNLQSNAIVTGVAPVADGKVVITGVRLRPAPGDGLARLEANGSFDSTFRPPSLSPGAPSALVITPDGEILVSGFFSDLPNHSGLRTVVRLTADGDLETAIEPSAGAGDRIISVATLPDGGVVFSREPMRERNLRRATIGYTTPDGILVADALAGVGLYDLVLRLLPRSDGSVVLVGFFSTIGGKPWYGIARAVHGPTAILFNPRRTLPSEFAFFLQGELGRGYQIEASTDLNTWTPLSSVTATNSSLKVCDPSAVADRRFYRAVAQ
jgi:uncharacterized delta-60 repeat protein